MDQEIKSIAALNLGNLQGIGPLGKTNPAQSISQLTQIFSLVIGILTIIASIWFLFNLLSGAISLIGSGGDKTKVQEAQKRITNSLIGLVLVIVSVFIIQIIGEIIGIDILDLNSLINRLQ